MVNLGDIYSNYYGYASTAQTVDDQFHRQPARMQQSGCLYACWSTCLMTEGCRPILLLLVAVAGLRHCCCRVNVTLFSRVTLIRKLHSTSDLGHFHAYEVPHSRVKVLQQSD